MKSVKFLAIMLVALGGFTATLTAPAFATGDDPCTCEPEPKEKGNNGWGNGIDGDNPGTDKGNASQRSSKTNTSNSPFEDKFEGR